MRTIILTLTTIAFLTSCNSSAKKVENATENAIEADKNLNEANAELEKANAEYQADMNMYRKENAEKIEANTKSIMEFNSRIALEKAKTKAEYKLKIDELNKKNSDMKMKLDNYKSDSKENWSTFKTEFNHDMDELGLALKNLTVKNTKTNK